MEKTRKPNPLRSEEMQNRLIETARELFVRQGYAATSTPEIVKVAGVTRGALYHHFADKKDLFRAVIQREAESVGEQIEANSQIEDSARQALLAGALAYFDAIAVPGRAQLLLIEGPSILGLAEMAEFDAMTSCKDLANGLDEAIRLGELEPVPTQEMAEILSASFDRAALASLAKPRRKQAFVTALERLFIALLDWKK